ncbi:MAG: aconitase X catalytic domain-containing protein [Elusimicrobia bacterium]|nr:aconitase X catalytic domain-containing protein [Elusimicrobiota bacterium]
MKKGKGAAKAMEILEALGRIHGARDMVPVGSVQVSGVSYGNIGEHGLAFLEEWAAMGSKAVVPATMNPGGSDRRIWKSLGFSAAYVRKQERVIKALEGLGIRPSLTCTPYHVGVTPKLGEHVAWAESSAVCFANSVLGARTNREGGPSAIAAALTGLTPRHTLHTDEGRLPTRVIEVRCLVPAAADAGALGYLVGRLVSSDKNGGVPFLTGTTPPAGPERLTWLKALGAGMAASGSVGLYHLDCVTPEAAAQGSKLAKAAKQKSVVDSLDEGRRALNCGKGKLDVVAVGCPHASPEDLTRILRLLNWRKAKVPFWIFVAEDVRKHAGETGVAAALGRCGATLVADTCIVVAPLQELGIHTVATDSAKAAFYLPSHHGAGVYFGSLEQNVEAALRGFWKEAPDA